MQLRRTMRTINEAMLKVNKIIKGTMVLDMSIGSTTNVEDMEVEVDSLGIETTNHVNPSNVLHVIRRDIGMQTVHTRIELTSNFVLIAE